VWGWVFGFCNTRQFWVFEKIPDQRKPMVPGYLKKFQNQRTAGSGYFGEKKNQIQRTAGSGYFGKKKIRFKEPLVLGTLEKKIQIQRTAGSGYLKKLQ
jgi:hypothetical protein